MSHLPNLSPSVVDDLHDVAATLEQLRERASGQDAVALDYLAGAVRRSAASVETGLIPSGRQQHDGRRSWQQ